jgi:Asp/Glu/hydantoin racemase
MRVLLVNPNTSGEITDNMLALAREAMPDIAFDGATGRFGARYIASRAAAAIAAHAALEAVAERLGPHAAVYLACFGDPGLAALREISPVPVVGMAEAACREAAREGRRFSIVTGGQAWEAMLTEFVGSLGLSQALASVRTLAVTGGDIARDPEGSLAGLAQAVRACAEQDGAQVVILGGAGLAGLVPRLAPRVDVPLISSFHAGLAALRAAAGHGAPLATPAPPAQSTGLAEALARRLR